MIYIFKFCKSFFEFEFLFLKPLDQCQTTPKIDLSHSWVTTKSPRTIIEPPRTTIELLSDHHQATLDHHQATLDHHRVTLDDH
jgi:hypothetical protein